MLVTKFFKKKIPSFRHKKELNIYDNTFFFLKNKKYTKYLIKQNMIKRKKKFYNTKLVNLNVNILNYTYVICKNFFYDFKPYKKFIKCKTIYNVDYVIPGIMYLNIGKILYNYKNLLNNIKNFFIRGLVLYLVHMPYNSKFSNLTNFKDNKITYAKSSGTFCKKKQTKKNKKKLFLVVLPSSEEILVNKNCKGYYGENQNFRINKLTEGKFGFSFYKKKKIKVRGVAMNPVDHPNGGRAKTVQPEKSP
jgi:ribosomal protein L2